MRKHFIILFLLLRSTLALAAPANVQHKLGPDVGNVGDTSVSITFTGAVASGNAVTGGLTYANAAGDKFTGIDDDKGNTYTIRSKFFDVTNTQFNLLFYLENITNAPTTITAHFSSGVAFRRMTAAEWSGVATVSAIDGSTGQETTGSTSTDAQSSGNITTVANGDVIYSTFGDSTGAGASWTQGTGFTSLDIAAGSDAIPMGHEYLIQSSAGSIAGTWTQSVSGVADVMVLALKSAGGGGPSCGRAPALHAGC